VDNTKTRTLLHLAM